MEKWSKEDVRKIKESSLSPDDDNPRWPAWFLGVFLGVPAVILWVAGIIRLVRWALL